MLVACRIGTKAYGLHSGREEGKGMEEDAKLLVSRRDIAIPELRVEDASEFRPVGVQGLIGPVSLIGEKGFLLGSLDEGGIHIEGGVICGVLPIYGSHKSGVDALKSGEKFGQGRNGGLAANTGIVRMKGREIAKDGRRGRDRPVFLLPPPLLNLPPLPSRKSIKFYTAEYAAKPFIGFQDAEVIDRVSSCEVEEDQGHDDLLIRPTLELNVEMS
jgi:hypothetical protein